VTFSLLQTGSSTSQLTSSNNVPSLDPVFVTPYDVSVVIETSRTFPSFRQAVLVATVVSPDAAGDYHLQASSPARAAGGLNAGFPQVLVYPTTGGNGTRHDIDNEARPIGAGTPQSTNVDAGADERS
jgi:hypothetical protein